VKPSDIIIAAALVLSPLSGEAASAEARRVTFVCEHGVAKSVIAAAIFNREAAARGFDVVAQARGIAPEAALQPATVAGLKADGLDVSGFRPTPVSPSDVSDSELIVTIGVAVAPSYLRVTNLREWDAVPPVSDGYGPARDAIAVEVAKLIAHFE
jgi:arsenate reductase